MGTFGTVGNMGFHPTQLVILKSYLNSLSVCSLILVTLLSILLLGVVLLEPSQNA
jgi:hypothetical protein